MEMRGVLCGPSCSSGLCVLLPLYSRCPRHRHLHNSPFSPLYSPQLASCSSCSCSSLPSMAALTTHYSSTRCTNRYRSNITASNNNNNNNNNTSNHGSTSSTAPLLLLLPCRQSTFCTHPVPSVSRLVNQAYSKNEKCVWTKIVARPTGHHVLLERCLTEELREMLFR